MKLILVACLLCVVAYAQGDGKSWQCLPILFLKSNWIRNKQILKSGIIQPWWSLCRQFFRLVSHTSAAAMVLSSVESSSFLFDWCFTPNESIFSLHDDGQRYSARKSPPIRFSFLIQHGTSTSHTKLSFSSFTHLFSSYRIPGRTRTQGGEQCKKHSLNWLFIW